MRKYEMQVILGIQDFSGLEAVYAKRFETIISNAGMNCILPTTDERTIQYGSRMIGMHTVREKVEGTPLWLRFLLPRSMRIPNRYQNVERPLKNFEQMRDTLTPGRGRMVVVCEGRPFVAGVIKYWKVLPVRRYAVSTYTESFGRAFTRKWLRRGKP
jgi:type IV secretory pathway TraG/TraD family ATPase VirD4